MNRLSVPPVSTQQQDSSPTRVDVLGVRISAVGMAEVTDAVERWIEKGERRYVCVTGVHGVMESQRDPALRDIHNAAGLTVPDGVPMVWAGRYAGAEAIERVYGPDMMLAVCGLAADRGWSSFLYGGAPGVADQLATHLRQRFSALRIAGADSPPFRDLGVVEDREIVERINASGAQLVWVGLSTPKQERWMSDHVDRIREPVVLLGVGAAFDIHAGLKRDAPRWIGRLGLHWMFRLAQEPRRLWRRYLWANPRFVARILRRPPRLVTGGAPVADRGRR
jgi:N-acetylglucosaminyldiphosphoundecaprenol N-acetyl-beta-D-mannosaminyltransferase